MKIVLRDDIDNVGRKGDLIEVADGYARNYLVPRGLAIVATKGTIKQAQAMQRSREVREAREREAAEAVAGRLRDQTVRIQARVGEAGKLFGSVTATDVADAVAEQLEVELDRKKLDLGEPIREVGMHDVSLKLHPEVEASFHVVVLEKK